MLSALNWSWIAETAQSLGIVRILQVTLVLTNRLLVTAIPAAAEKHLSADPAALTLADEIAPQLGRATPHDVESVLLPPDDAPARAKGRSHPIPATAGSRTRPGRMEIGPSACTAFSLVPARASMAPGSQAR